MNKVKNIASQKKLQQKRARKRKTVKEQKERAAKYTQKKKELMNMQVKEFMKFKEYMKSVGETKQENNN